MLPAMTRSPPNFLIPRYFGLLSRPLRDEPTPFLCAMRSSASAESDVVDLHFREALPVALLLRVVLPALHLEDDDLVAKAVLHDLAGDLRPGEGGHAGLDVVAVAAEEDIVELDGPTGLAHDGGDAIFLARLDTELLAAGADDGVGHE